MANIAIIIAGGSGHRMGQDIPKQFINVYDKPVLIYTLESFQKHPQIDAIEVVCIDGWHDILWAYAKQFNIDKLKWVVSGGSTVTYLRLGLFCTTYPRRRKSIRKVSYVYASPMMRSISARMVLRIVGLPFCSAFHSA